MGSNDCLIVGGGIGGAVLALALGRAGRHVLVLEREKQPPPAGRVEILAGLTMGIFEKLGAADRIRREAAVALEALEVRLFNERTLLRLSADDFKDVGAQPFATDPARTRKILIEAALATGKVTLERGVEVRELLKDGSRVIGVRAVRDGLAEEHRAKLVVGDDGGQSRVRLSLEIPIRTTEFEMEFIGTVGPALPGFPRNEGRVYLRPAGFTSEILAGIFMPLPENRAALVFISRRGNYDRFKADPTLFYNSIHRMAPAATTLERDYPFPQSFAHARRPFGHADRYVADGAALMGDAAHPVTPAGGQGANMSVADAMALAQTILGAPDFSAASLSAYEALRRPANTRSLQFSRRAHIAFHVGNFCPPLVRLLPQFLKYVNRRRGLRKTFITAISKTFASGGS